MPSAAGNQTFKLVVDDTLCHHCRRCLAGEVCRGNAFISFDPADSPFIDMSRCWGCLACLVTCPFGAVTKLEYGGEVQAAR